MSQTTTTELQDPRHRRARLSRHGDLRVLTAIAAGGALGAPARYALAELAPAEAGRFPWSTLGINLTGSLALGVILALVLERFPPSRYVRPFLATGFLGAYTTYSTFAVETVLLVRDAHPATAGTYTITSVMGGLAAVWAGMTLGRALPLPIGGRT